MGIEGIMGACERPVMSAAAHALTVGRRSRLVTTPAMIASCGAFPGCPSTNSASPGRGAGDGRASPVLEPGPVFGARRSAVDTRHAKLVHDSGVRRGRRSAVVRSHVGGFICGLEHKAVRCPVDALSKASCSNSSGIRPRRRATSENIGSISILPPRFFKIRSRCRSATEEHSAFEERWVTMGWDRERRLLVVSHADTSTIGDKMSVRIISARRATRSERLQYESG